MSVWSALAPTVRARFERAIRPRTPAEESIDFHTRNRVQPNASMRARGRTTKKTRKSYRRRSRGLEMLQAWAALQAGGESIIWYATVFATPVVVTKR